jgi:uncharacterized protein YdhG (YjbR/CyaY superfamily)
MPRATSTQPRNIDEYIAASPAAARPGLEQLRTTIRAAAPDAIEKISYGMPTFYLNGNLVHFAAFKAHLGFYPGAAAIAAFAAELAPYGPSKGTVRFPLDAAVPLDLVDRITRYRVAAASAGGPRRRRR